MLRFTKENFVALCDKLSANDMRLNSIVSEYGYPPLWTRPNTFETLVLTILEQQVSLASAYAAYKKLKERLGKITPQGLLSLSDKDLRSCYFSRQKIVYTRGLAETIVAKKINLKAFETKEDAVIRKELTALKGIGNWTVDIYLLHALQHADVFPVGDLALVNAVKMITGQSFTKEEIMAMAETWKPYRSIATMILWHYYIKKKNIKLLH
ncbi:DNA-3-methyladenine glycosylase family protein [Flavisolibacter ginsenosidimutans]|uniref:DNA-3-methyladenine glycosylase II n=1 Tax=Flavisolibacter ginsenosidimutans TaxID=661481 RepID=A0A5B8UNP2_9BACT|nr:DNA-3-methyladenine glycosylase [Flavisolibacter ginsenosidimutans]QEC57680.1 DNA-3-methyladenine glycosylase 2 family protein [Flavisolibacter ginsenosidimutans]